jgi:hypothetical protein
MDKNWKDRTAYHDAVICGAIERHATMSEAMKEISQVMPWVDPTSIKVRAYVKRRQMVHKGRIDPMHGITHPTKVNLHASR